MYGYVWLCRAARAMYGSVEQCGAMYGCVWQCMGMHGSVWVCMAV